MSRQATLRSLRLDWTLDADGVIKRKPPLPAGLGKIFPSMSQVLFQLPYKVSSGSDKSTGRRPYIALSNIAHISADSEIWVSASMIGCMKTSGEFGLDVRF